MEKTRRKKRKSGVRAAAHLAWAFAFLGLICVAGVPAAAKKKDKQQPFALVAGTVFRDTGFALRGAEVSLIATPEGSSKIKVKPQKLVSDARGEFVFKVPAAPMRYTLSVKAQGFREQSKPASITGDERVDVFFHLEAELKK